MTRYYLDDRDITPDLPAGVGMSEVFHALESLTRGEHLYIREILFDGDNVLTEEFDPGQFPAEKMQPVEEVRIHSIPPNELVMQTIVGFVGFLEELSEPLDGLIADCRHEPDEYVYEKLKDLLVSLQELLRLFSITEELGNIRFAEILVKGKRADKIIQEFTEIIGEVINCREKDDLPAMADLLEFEIKPRISWIIDLFQQVLSNLS